jgi:hypothetical protein
MMRVRDGRGGLNQMRDVELGYSCFIKNYRRRTGEKPRWWELEREGIRQTFEDDLGRVR